MSVLSSHLTDN